MRLSSFSFATLLFLSLKLPKMIARPGRPAGRRSATSPSRMSLPSRTVGSRYHAALVDALHAVAALLHDAAGAHADVGIAHQLDCSGLPSLEEQEVEAAHLVGTVVGAVARAHAAVVDHGVEAFGGVDGGADGADLFAGRVLAVQAGHGLEVGADCRGRLRSRCRRESTACGGRAASAPCRRRRYCFPTSRRRCSRCSRRTCSGRWSCPRRTSALYRDMACKA